METKTTEQLKKIQQNLEEVMLITKQLTGDSRGFLQRIICPEILLIMEQVQLVATNLELKQQIEDLVIERNTLVTLTTKSPKKKSSKRSELHD